MEKYRGDHYSLEYIKYSLRLREQNNTAANALNLKGKRSVVFDKLRYESETLIEQLKGKYQSNLFRLLPNSLIYDELQMLEAWEEGLYKIINIEVQFSQYAQSELFTQEHIDYLEKVVVAYTIQFLQSIKKQLRLILTDKTGKNKLLKYHLEIAKKGIYVNSPDNC